MKCHLTHLIMKVFLHFVLTYALLFSSLNSFSQVSNSSQSTANDRSAKIIKIVEGHHCPYSVSDNKKHVVIQGYTEASSYYWSEETGGISFSGSGFAVNDDGIVAGCYTNSDGYNVAGLWHPDTQEWEFLGMNPVMPEFILDNYDYNGAWAMSNDGKKIGIMQFDEFWNTGTFVWSEEEGYVQLPNGGSSVTRPQGMSSDGSVVAGFFTDDIGYRGPCYWIDGEIFQIGSYPGEAWGVSPNGRYVCGFFNDSKGCAFVYDIQNDELTMIENTLTTILGSMTALCVTDEGNAFGYISTDNPADYYLRRGFAYVNGEIMSFEEFLLVNGVQEADSWKVYTVNDVTPDGRTFIGSASMKEEDHTFLLTIYDNECDAPTNLTCTIDEDNHTTAILNWEAPENPVDVTYEIYTSYTSIDPVFSGLTETTLSIENLAPGHYSFLVKANWGNECMSNPTNTVNFTIYPCAPEEMCELSFNMLDGYGDGWNGAYIDIKSENSNFTYTVGLDKEGLDTVTKHISLCPDNYVFIWNRGEIDEEISFIITFKGKEIYRAETGDIDPMFETLFFEYEINCDENDTLNITDIYDTSSVIIHPIPTKDKLYISSDETIEVVAIYNINGQQATINSQQTSSTELIINIGHLSPGIYFVRVKSDNFETMKRFVKN